MDHSTLKHSCRCVDANITTNQTGLLNTGLPVEGSTCSTEHVRDDTSIGEVPLPQIPSFAAALGVDVAGHTCEGRLRGEGLYVHYVTREVHITVQCEVQTTAWSNYNSEKRLYSYTIMEPCIHSLKPGYARACQV